MAQCLFKGNRFPMWQFVLLILIGSGLLLVSTCLRFRLKFVLEAFQCIYVFSFWPFRLGKSCETSLRYVCIRHVSSFFGNILSSKIHNYSY